MAEDQKEVKETAPKANTKEFYEEKAKEAKENGADVILDITSKIKVEFLKDVGFIKKGHKQEISTAAFEVYNLKEKTVKEIR